MNDLGNRGIGRSDGHLGVRLIVCRLYLVGIMLKGFDGALEVIGGIVLFFVSNASINRLLLLLMHEELAEDPKDFIANYMVRLGQHLSVSSKTFVSIYLLGHSLIKIVLVANLLRNKRWAYTAAIVILLGFIGYQVLRDIQQFSVTLTVITVFDMFIVTLIWLEYRGIRLVTRS